MMRGVNRTSLLIGNMLVAVVLSACGGDDTSNHNPPPAELELTALVVGEADSPFLNILKEGVEMVQDDGSQKVTNHDLFIFDGDTHSPPNLAENPRLAEAVATRTWVLVTDATEAHKQEGTEPFLGFATQGDTDAFLFRGVPGDMPVFDIMEMPPLATGDLPDTPHGNELRAQRQEWQHRKFVERIIAKVASGTTVQQGGGCVVPLNIQSGIIFATWCYGSPLDWQIDTVGEGIVDGSGVIYAGEVIDGKTVQPQLGQNDANFTFTLLLNNKDTVTGDFQTLHVEVDGQMTPTTTTWPDGTGDGLDGQPYFMGEWFGPLAAGYFQSDLEIRLEPDAAMLLKPAAIFAPQTPNNTETESYSSSTTFSIAATLNAASIPSPGGGGGVTGTYATTSTNTTSYTISDWTWTADLSGSNSYDWHFNSTNPPSGDFEQGSQWDFGWTQPNELSQDLMQYSAAAVWTTSGISADTFDFSVYSKQSLPSFQTLEGIPLSFASGEVQEVAQVLSIDLGAVVPVTLQPDSLTFTDQNGNPVTENNPVAAGEDVTATVQLSGPAPLNYSISATATSANKNAAIAKDPVTITKGATNKSFTIETNDNDLDLRETVAVPISLGSFGSTATEQLWIQGPLFE